MNTLRQRARALGIIAGKLPVGPLNAITDVAGVCVGHCTLVEGDAIRTGVTAILPHQENIFQEKTPAGLAVGNGFGKFMGSTQIEELGEIETPLLLTNTLCAPRAAEALLNWTLSQPGNESVGSVNPVVGETNDGWLNDIRQRAVRVEHCMQALAAAQPGAVAEGCSGAGTGTVAFGWKGGIGSSSRRLAEDAGGWTVGVLVQTNFGGDLRLPGFLPERPAKPAQAASKTAARSKTAGDPDAPPGQPPLGGSIILVVATDAPLSDRNLTRLARRALGGLARSGAALANQSGDYALAFSTHPEVRRTPARRRHLNSSLELPNDLLSPLFLAAIEASEEAIYNSLCMAETTTGFQGHTAQAIPYITVLSLIKP